jgi:hypothetical protein
MVAAARGKPPPYKPWSASDPLGDGWNKVEKVADKVDVQVKPAPTKPSAKPAKPAKPAATSELVKLAIVGLAGLAALGYSERARLRAWGKRLVQRFRRKYGQS